MVHLTAIVASSAAIAALSLTADAAPAAARHLRAGQPGGNAIAAKRDLVAGAELVVGAWSHSPIESKAAFTKAKKAKSKTKTKKARGRTSTSAAPGATRLPDALVSAAVGVNLGHARRAIGGFFPDAGIPGFVEVATLLPGASALTRSVAGLVFTATPAGTSSSPAFELSTSTAQSTQFFVVRYAS